MKISQPVFSFIFAVVAVASAEDITFKTGSQFTDSFLETTHKNMVTIEEGPDSEGLLAFRSDGGGTMLTLSSGQKELISAADEVEIEFRTEGTTTLGIFLRGQGEGGDSYMAFLSASSERTLMLYLCKTKQTSAQQPGQTALVSKHIQNYIPGDWYKLKLSLGENSGGVTFSGRLLGAAGGQELIDISADDTDNPITQAGAILFRLNGDKAKGGGVIQIKRISVSP